MNTKNRLSQEKSPYLLQHQFNPVEWYAWGAEAFEKARQENKPIFLSIGYATCHWCHVMERESFEDPFVATLLNQAFVNIKVDREERPDVDSIYMSACQLMTGHGGWPLNAILTPDREPFFAATYIPKVTRHGHLGLVDLIPRVQELWQTQREKLVGSSKEILTALQKLTEKKIAEQKSTEDRELGAEPLHKSFQIHCELYDKEWGGFGGEPKFPALHHLSHLLRYHERFGSQKALEMVIQTLDNILAGGIYDHVGGGIHRYSVDNQWFVPHFEKMLYDQASLIRSLAEAYRVTQNDHYKAIATLTVEYLFRDLGTPEGLFYSAEDADSEGEEGRFYIWSRAELEGMDAKLLAIFNPMEPGNFLEHGQVRTGNVLRMSPAEHRKALKSDEWKVLRGELLNLRNQRLRPLRDQKILLDWNSFVISALSFAGRVFSEKSWISAAIRAGHALEVFRQKDNSLFHVKYDSDSRIPGFLDDYAYALDAFTELFLASQDLVWLGKARDVAELMVTRFYDTNSSLFFQTALDGEKLILRKIETSDGAYPCGNSMAASALGRLAHIVGDQELEKLSEKLISRMGRVLEENPLAHCFALCALDDSLGPKKEFYISGDGASAQKMFETLIQRLGPRESIARVTSQNSLQWNTYSPSIKQFRQTTEDLLYVCEDRVCKSPIILNNESIDSLLVRYGI